MRERARPLLSSGKTSAEPWFAFKTPGGDSCRSVILVGDKETYTRRRSSSPALIANPVSLSQNERAQR